MSQPSDPPFSLSAAWDLLRDALGWLVALFGAPAQLREQRAHARRDHALLLSWLRSLEALAARLLLLAAREITPAQARPRAGRPRAARVSNAWRVSFRAPGLAAPKPARRSYGRRLGRARETQSCLGAAARFEALRRLAENPAAYARRLARALRRDPGAQMRIALAPIRACDPFAENAQEARDYIVRKSAFADSS